MNWFSRFKTEWLRPSLFYGNNPLSLIGGALTSASALTLVGFWVVDIFGHGGSNNPYLGILFDLSRDRSSRSCLPARHRFRHHRHFHQLRHRRHGELSRRCVHGYTELLRAGMSCDGARVERLPCRFARGRSLYGVSYCPRSSGLRPCQGEWNQATRDGAAA
jgi:hypothetical protein